MLTFVQMPFSTFNILNFNTLRVCVVGEGQTWIRPFIESDVIRKEQNL